MVRTVGVAYLLRHLGSSLLLENAYPWSSYKEQNAVRVPCGGGSSSRSPLVYVWECITGKQEKKYAVPGGKLPKGGLKLAIGDRSDGVNADAIQGYVDEFRIYERALTGAEVQKNMNAQGLDVSPSANHLSVYVGTH